MQGISTQSVEEDWYDDHEGEEEEEEEKEEEAAEEEEAARLSTVKEGGEEDEEDEGDEGCRVHRLQAHQMTPEHTMASMEKKIKEGAFLKGVKGSTVTFTSGQKATVRTFGEELRNAGVDEGTLDELYKKNRTLYVTPIVKLASLYKNNLNAEKEREAIKSALEEQAFGGKKKKKKKPISFKRILLGDEDEALKQKKVK